MNNPSVAVLDIGSNSIKILVAARGTDGELAALKMRTIDARIGAGLGEAKPRLHEDGLQRGLAAVQSLLADATEFSPQQIVLVATSAVRDAANGAEFRQRVFDATGHPLRILTGDEEADLIGRGLICDRALAALRDFYVFDLGGGSLECLAFEDRRVRQAASLQLGCVRLTELFVAEVAQPFGPETAAAIARHTREIMARAGFKFDLPAATAIATGGTMTVARAILGARSGRPIEQTAAKVTVNQLRELLGQLGALPLAERQRVPGLPAARADVFPTALATLIAVAEAGGFAEFRHSFYNLRWGLAAQALGEPAP